MRAAVLVLVIAAGAAVSGCDSDPVGPTVESVSAAYAADTLTTTSGGQTTDHLARGASLEINLRADGTTSGRLFVPEAGEDGGDLDEDLTGTWTLSGTIVRFSQAADTFVRDMPFSVRGTQLVAQATFFTVEVRVVLGRRGPAQ